MLSSRENNGDNLDEGDWVMRYKPRIAALLAGLFLVGTFFFLTPEKSFAEPTLYWGKSGYQVQRVQQRLSAWGYYRGSIDGSYGFRTWRAVRTFQARNGLWITGTVNDQTWRALGLTSGVSQAAPRTSAGSVSRSDSVHLLARVIQGEAAGESFTGKVAVGAVIMNRVRNASFPNTLSGVIFQGSAFESVLNGLIWRVTVSPDSYRAAQLALSGWDPTHGSTFFWNPYKPVSPWIWTRRIFTQIGRHVFGK